MHSPYQRKFVLDEIKDFSATTDGQRVTTMLGEHSLNSVVVSSQYQLFNFKDYITTVLETLERVMQPERYYIEIKKGVQEINILSAPFDVCGEQYCKGFYILNSTDKTRALQFMAGLYRVGAGTEIVMHIKDELVDIFSSSLGNGATYAKVVHKGKNFHDKIDEMRAFIDRMPLLIDIQILVLQDLGIHEVSMKSLYRRMFYENAGENADGRSIPASASRVRTQAFARQLMRGSDKLMLTTTSTESAQDFTDLGDPVKFLNRAAADIYVNCYQALQCYMNAYKSRDTSVLRRESKRFTDLLEEVGTRAIETPSFMLVPVEAELVGA